MVAMAATTLLTSDQFLAMPEEFDKNGNELRQELICGDVVNMPPPSQTDAIIRSNVLEAFFPYLRANDALGLKALSRTAFVVSANSVFVPGVALLPLSRLNPGRQTYLQGAPDLAIEVMSPTDLEVHLRRKIGAYLDHGSKSVWVVYPDARSVMIYHTDSIREFKGDQHITDALLPGFSTPVAAFFDLT
jgi:Uma2 family endonuclease